MTRYEWKEKSPQRWSTVDNRNSTISSSLKYDYRSYLSTSSRVLGRSRTRHPAPNRSPKTPGLPLVTPVESSPNRTRGVGGLFVPRRPGTVVGAPENSGSQTHS